MSDMEERLRRIREREERSEDRWSFVWTLFFVGAFLWMLWKIAVFIWG